MVQAKQPAASAIRDRLGPSRWFHVTDPGADQDKWSAAEGALAVDLLRRMPQADHPPDVYVITPFVVVQNHMRMLIRQSGLLDAWKCDERWLYERVGTVHVVQGREAEAVVFVLGAPVPSQTGARGWAGGKPNILNVAVTRAKEALYVVGNRALWQRAGVFQRTGQVPAATSSQLPRRAQGGMVPSAHDLASCRGS